ncbi:MAG: prepilin-type N-terminal cleavage/methylation domain-containing protein [Planctomycetes bacterium]|nr:prepilin-type N-terminal cleavage/methylation domain-containing protein [Planctomycetota bacterium]
MKRIGNNRRGFTLAECMIALTVLSVAATGVLIPFSSAASVHAEGMRRTLASKVASDLVEEICATNYDSIIGTWNDYAEAEGHITMTGSAAEFTGDAYNFFSRWATCKTASIGSDDDATMLGIWVTVAVDYRGNEIIKLSTLVSE